MLQAERQAAILHLLDQHHSVTVAQLCDALAVSDMTVRRDLREMDGQGLLRRVYGGAVKIVRHSYEPPYTVRQNQLLSIKQQIGKKAAALIANGDSLALDVGTTTLEVARALSGRRELTIVTASLPIANEIAGRYALEGDIRLMLTGGILRARELSLVGHHAAQLFRDVLVDKAFIGVAGVSLEHGLTEYNLDDALVKRAMIASAGQVIVVADGSKFGQTTFAAVAPLTEVDVVVTDHSADPTTIAGLQAADIEVLFADDL
jgi:DeoR/GlpR family transcriptional regulator of sugar metabolism